MIPHRLRVRKRASTRDPRFRLRKRPFTGQKAGFPCLFRTVAARARRFPVAATCRIEGLAGRLRENTLSREYDSAYHESMEALLQIAKFDLGSLEAAFKECFFFLPTVDASTGSFARKPRKPDRSGRASEEGKSARGLESRSGAFFINRSFDHSINRMRAASPRARRIRGARARASGPFPRPTPRPTRCSLRAFRADPQAKSPGTRT